MNGNEKGEVEESLKQGTQAVWIEESGSGIRV